MKWKMGLLILLILLSSGCWDNNKLSQRIFETIDKKCEPGNAYCSIPIAEITDFKWDKMAIYGVGSSNKEVSAALGVEYEDSTDLMSGMVFVYNNKIVYNEGIPYNPEHPGKLWINIGFKPGEPSCLGVTPDNAFFIGSRENIDGVFYYEIEAKPMQAD
ncbi:MAG: hypothetical protein HPY50_04675 [Firmicutes bacterium]|nr:hypothetical protein [Bacillota bacterium]